MAPAVDFSGRIHSTGKHLAPSGGKMADLTRSSSVCADGEICDSMQ